MVRRPESQSVGGQGISQGLPRARRAAALATLGAVTHDSAIQQQGVNGASPGPVFTVPRVWSRYANGAGNLRGLLGTEGTGSAAYVSRAEADAVL